MGGLIDGQSAIDRIRGTGYADQVKENVIMILMGLPSVQPEANRSEIPNSSDTISRQAAIDEIRRFAGYLDEDMINRIHIALKRLPATQSEQDWIPCKKPPTENNAYLVTVHPDYVIPGSGQVDILVWVDDGWFFMAYDTKTARYQITRFPDPVIAWRPLPAPYKEANK